MSDLRGSRRFEAAPSSSPLMWGVGLVAVGMVVREAAVERHLELLVRGGDSQWGMVAWAGGTELIYYVITVLVGINFILELAINLVLSNVIVRVVGVRKAA